MTAWLFRDFPYQRHCEARVVNADARGIVLDCTIFYPHGGGQPGDTGTLVREDGTVLPIVDTLKGETRGEIVHVLPAGSLAPRTGESRDPRARLGTPLRAHADAHRVSPALGGAALSGHGRLDPPRFRAARLRHAGVRGRQGRDRGEGERAHRSRPRGRLRVDRRRRLRSPRGSRAHAGGRAATRNRARAAGARRRTSTCRRAAGPMSRTRARSDRSSCRRSRTRASRIARVTIAFTTPVVPAEAGTQLGVIPAKAGHAALRCTLRRTTLGPPPSRGRQINSRVETDRPPAAEAASSARPAHGAIRRAAADRQDRRVRADRGNASRIQRSSSSASASSRNTRARTLARSASFSGTRRRRHAGPPPLRMLWRRSSVSTSAIGPSGARRADRRSRPRADARARRPARAAASARRCATSSWLLNR